MTSKRANRPIPSASTLHSLHSQISNTVIDYSPWMRQQRRPSKSDEETKTFVVGLAPVREERKCSARCRHTRKEPSPEPVPRENPVKIQWLTAQLDMYRTRIESHLQRENELRQHNFQLRETISNTESSCHDAVAANLRRYDQCKTTISLVEGKQIEEKEALLESFARERHALVSDVEMFEKQVLALENELSACQQSLKQLKIFKKSEYPEKQELLRHLSQELDEMKLMHSEEMDELTRILHKQREQYDRNLSQTVQRLQAQQATKVLSDMDASYLLVARDNDRMREEIAVQKEQVRLMEMETGHIRKLNANLKRENNQAFDSRTLFPHVFRPQSMPICTPDMDVVLDLPKRTTPLPV